VEIKINISGPEGSGKTTVARIIADALASKGIACEVSDFDFKVWQNDRLAALKKRGDLLVKVESHVWKS
jgi:thymidylate kinase